MKKQWSSKWKSSKQPRKQRKYRYEAPLHIKRKFLSASLAKPLRERYERRSMILRKGDEVIVMKGDIKGTKGIIEKADIKKGKVYIEGVKMKKVDGSEVSRPIAPPNLLITKLNLDDKKRQAVLERSGKAAKKKGGG